MKSTPQEIEDARLLVKQTETEIACHVRKGKRVHIIWDFDSVLASPLSEDIFKFIKYDFEKYFEYEAKLLLSPPKPGIWLPLAKKVKVLHASQDIVTARSSFLGFRVMLFCMWYCGTNLSQWVRWILQIGHRSKSDSFRIILESLQKDKDVFIYFIDDNPKHVEAFCEVSRTLGMVERTAGIVSPKIRDYTEEQLQWHYERITNAEDDHPTLIPGTPGGYANGFIVFPNGLDGFRNLITENFLKVERDSAIREFGPLLKMTFQDLFPDEPITPEGLHFAFRYLQEEATHDTMVLNEIMEQHFYLKEKGVTREDQK